MGQRGTVVDVSKGYLRNFLIPRKLAQPATKSSIAAAERHQKTLDRAAAEATQRAEESAELLNKTVLTIAHQAGDDGRLFGSVTSQDIVDAIKEARGLEDRQAQGAPRGADPHGRHPHGDRRGRRRRARQRQDHGGRGVGKLPPLERGPAEHLAAPAPGSGPGQWAGAPSAALDPDGGIAIAYRVRTSARRGGSVVLARTARRRAARARRGDRQGPLRRGVARAARAGAPPPGPAGGCTSPAPTPGSKHWWICALDARPLDRARGGRTAHGARRRRAAPASRTR